MSRRTLVIILASLAMFGVGVFARDLHELLIGIGAYVIGAMTVIVGDRLD